MLTAFYIFIFYIYFFLFFSKALDLHDGIATKFLRLFGIICPYLTQNAAPAENPARRERQRYSNSLNYVCKLLVIATHYASI